MSHVVCIAGESGTGKTTSMRKLAPETTLYIDCDKKGLSWKGWKADFNGANKNYLVTDFPQVALNALRKVNEQENMKHIKVVVVDMQKGCLRYFSGLYGDTNFTVTLLPMSKKLVCMRSCVVTEKLHSYFRGVT